MKDILPELNGKDYIEALRENYEIRFCKIEEVEELVAFLKEYWRRDHIFVLSRKLLDWQHLDKQNNRYNFVIGKCKKTGEIHSILGFVPTSQFDNSIKRMEVWPCIWKSRDDIKVKGLGVSLYHYLKSTLPVETIAILGISEIALSIYKHWNFSTGQVKQFYMLNREKKSFALLENVPRELERRIKIDSEKRLEVFDIKEIDKMNIEVLNTISIYKSKDYYVNRYLKHPMYQYKAYKVVVDDVDKLVLITRECGVKEKCCRVVDYFGKLDELVGCEEVIQQLLISKNYEYIDFVFAGIDGNMLKSAGFRDRDESEIVIPNYFEPFLRKNVKLDYALKTVVDDIETIFVKADADQDRPNQL